MSLHRFGASLRSRTRRQGVLLAPVMLCLLGGVVFGACSRDNSEVRLHSTFASFFEELQEEGYLSVMVQLRGQSRLTPEEMETIAKESPDFATFKARARGKVEEELSDIEGLSIQGHLSASGEVAVSLASEDTLLELLQRDAVVAIRPNWKLQPALSRAADHMNVSRLRPGGVYASEGYLGEGEVVAVIDTGVDYRHSALEHAIYKDSDDNIVEYCSSSRVVWQDGETEGGDPIMRKTLSMCPDDALESEAPGAGLPNRGEDFVHEDPANIVIGHGTKSAVMIASRPPQDDFDSDLIGFAPSAKIIPLNITTENPPFVCNADGDETRLCGAVYWSDYMRALEFISYYQMRHALRLTVSASLYSTEEEQRERYSDALPVCGVWGTPPEEWTLEEGTSPESAGIAYYASLLRQHGAIFVTAAGNESLAEEFPDECVPSMFNVGAVHMQQTDSKEGRLTTDVDRVTHFSNGGPGLDIFAVGEGIYTPVGVYDGTSAAAPIVSGGVAVLQNAVESALGKRLSVLEVEELLKKSGVPVVDHRNDVMTPRINICGAIAEAGVEVDCGPSWIQGLIWEEIVRDGAPAEGDEKFAGVIEVKLFDASGELQATTTTEEGGKYHSYQIDVPAPGDYYLEFNLPEGYVLTDSVVLFHPEKGSYQPSADNDRIARTELFHVSAGARIRHVHAGLVNRNCSNGIQDPEEEGIDCGGSCGSCGDDGADGGGSGGDEASTGDCTCGILHYEYYRYTRTWAAAATSGPVCVGYSREWRQNQRGYNGRLYNHLLYAVFTDADGNAAEEPLCYTDQRDAGSAGPKYCDVRNLEIRCD